MLFGVPKKPKRNLKESEKTQTFGERFLKLWKKPEQTTQNYKKFLDFKLKMSNKQKNVYYIKNLKFKILPFQMIFYGKAIDNLYKFYQSISEIYKVFLRKSQDFFLNYRNFLKEMRKMRNFR